MNHYTGVGSRKTPSAVLAAMTELAVQFRKEGITLRSGGATGADTAFELGAGDLKEIYLPWPDFNGSKSTLIRPSPAALMMVRSYHPKWMYLSPSDLLLHARNCHQVLGRDLKTPSDFLVCWTENGLTQGGTATAIKIALDHSIPITNLGIVR